MTKAVVYTSSGGHTAEYAKMFGESTGLPVYSLKEAKRELPEGTLVMYFGWIMAGRVQGYRRAAKRFRIRGICAVGLDGSLNQIT